MGDLHSDYQGEISVGEQEENLGKYGGGKVVKSGVWNYVEGSGE